MRFITTTGGDGAVIADVNIRQCWSSYWRHPHYFRWGKKEASISITNPDDVPYLIQSWIDVQDGQSGKAPFIITPPLYRLDGGQKP